MLYYKCPTCRTILANKQIPFEERMETICDDDKMTDKDKNNAKGRLLDELQLTRECCRMRILTYCKLIEIIK